MHRSIEGPWRLFAREFAFRAICRHRQGELPNILLYCMPRSGATWMLNTMAAHAGMRYVGRAFMSAQHSRWRRTIPVPANAGPSQYRQFIHFEGAALQQFERFAGSIVNAERHIYPTLRMWAPYFHRVTERVIFQVHSIFAMVEWFSSAFHVETMLLVRHPIPNALSIIARGWEDEAGEYLRDEWFVDTQLSGKQVDLARGILSDGSTLARHVLDWSLRMLVPFRALATGRHPDWLVVSYEQATLEPGKVVEVVSKAFQLPDIPAMMAQVRLPSRTVTPDTASRVQDPEYILGRWRQKVSWSAAQELMQIPEAFDLDAYSADRLGPSEPLLL